MPQDLNITHEDLTASAAGENDAALALLSGRMVASVKSHRTGEHITVQAKCSRRNETSGRWEPVPFERATHVFLDVPGTGDRYRRNDKIGTYYPSGKYAGKLWADRDADGARVWAALFALQFAAGRPVSDRAEFVLGDHCLRCGRELTHPDSVRRHLGADCAQVANSGQHQQKGGSGAPGRAVRSDEATEGAGGRPEHVEGSSGPEGDAGGDAGDFAVAAVTEEDFADLRAFGMIEYRPGRTAGEQLASVVSAR